MYNIIRTRLVRVIRHFVFNIYFFFLILELALIICSLVKILFRASWAIYYRYFDWYTRGRYDILLQLRRRGDSYHQSHVSPRPRASVVVSISHSPRPGVRRRSQDESITVGTDCKYVWSCARVSAFDIHLSTNRPAVSVAGVFVTSCIQYH